MVSGRLKRRSACAVAKPTYALKKSGRSRTGCFCCRKRKIKCDGAKPDCHNCDKASYLCVWPKGDESLPHTSSFKITKKQKPNQGKDWKFIESNQLPLETPVTSENDNEMLHTNIEHEKEEVERCHEAVSLDEASKVGSNTIVGLDSEQDLDHSMPPMTKISTDHSIIVNNSDYGVFPPQYFSGLLDDLEYFSSDDIIEADNYIEPYNDNDSSVDNIFNEMPADLKDFDDQFQESATSEDELDFIENIKFDQTITTASENFPLVEKEIHQDAIFRRYLTDVGTNVSLLSELNLTINEGILYEAFIGGYMVAISPQIAHINLQPGSVFVSVGIKKAPLKSLFLACGASFLACANSDAKMKELSLTYSNKAITELNLYVSQNSLSGNSEWLLVFLILYYIKQKLILENKETLTLDMIVATKIVKLWLSNNVKAKNSNQTQSESEANEPLLSSLECLDSLDAASAFYNINTNLELLLNQKSTDLRERGQPKSRRGSNSKPLLDPATLEMEITTKNDSKIILTPYQRTILESFVFNYTDSLFNSDEKYYHLLTSPFELFEVLRPYLLAPMYNCAVPWMNHPIVGACIPMIELQAKVCWLAHQTPLSEDNTKEANNILNLAKFFTHPILPSDVHEKEPEEMKRKLMESCHGSVILSKAVTLYTMKLLHPSLPISDSEIQNIVDSALSFIRKISLHSQSSVILIWAFAVISLAVVEPEQQEYFIWRMKNFGDVTKLRGFQTICETSYLAWESKENLGNAWRVLFNTESKKGWVL